MNDIEEIGFNNRLSWTLSMLNTHWATLQWKYQISRIEPNSGIDRFCRNLVSNHHYTPPLGLKKPKIKCGGFVHFCRNGKGFCPIDGFCPRGFCPRGVLSVYRYGDKGHRSHERPNEWLWKCYVGAWTKTNRHGNITIINLETMVRRPFQGDARVSITCRKVVISEKQKRPAILFGL